MRLSALLLPLLVSACGTGTPSITPETSGPVQSPAETPAPVLPTPTPPPTPPPPTPPPPAPPPAPKTPRNFTYFGDSIACGEGVTPLSQKWTGQLKTMLATARPAEVWTLIYGCQGGTGIRWAEERAPTLPGGDTIAVFIGRNDAKTYEDFRPRYEALIGVLSSKYRHVIPVIETPTLVDGQTVPFPHGTYRAIREAFPQALDLETIWLTDPAAPTWYADSVHMNYAGQTKLAQLMLARLP